ncbi:hypothetical protein Tco_1081315 [Tanacetum coccineum]|uniref:Retroviral polymerase SH3-like domain-containing protein n=1 Tax=Tanacetum coccineum TaxID=301880 RepID=A0ABQ5HX82_9ASTR
MQHDRLLKSTDDESIDQCISWSIYMCQDKDYALESATRILNMVPTKKALVKRSTPEKLQQRSIKCIFVGYPKETMGYYFYFPPKNKIVVASEHLVEAESLEPQEDVAPIRSLGDLNAPTKYKVALLDHDFSKWLDAMNTEMQSMKDNHVLCRLLSPPNAKNRLE